MGRVWNWRSMLSLSLLVFMAVHERAPEAVSLQRVLAVLMAVILFILFRQKRSGPAA